MQRLRRSQKDKQVTKTSKIISLLIIEVVISTGCSDREIKRTTYETLQNIREQECSRTPSVECEKRDKLEVYEKKRLEVKQGN